MTEQTAAAMTAKGHITAATYRITLPHAAYSQYFTMGQEKIAHFQAPS